MRATFDISRKPNDKSVFLFERCESAKLKFACLALSDTDTLRLLNFPTQGRTDDYVTVTGCVSLPHPLRV